jgi:tetratricopeptide (TPR) repeat protein
MAILNKSTWSIIARMSENELIETRPNPVNENPSPATRKKFPWWLAILVFIVLIAIGILGGYGSGMGKRYSAENTLVTGQLLEQYQLGLQAVEAGKYEVAKQHFEYIIQHNPDFPGVKDAYADLLLHMLITPTLIPTLTPTITPTPDLRSVDEIYNNILALLSASDKDLCARDWNGIINKLDSLRKADINYRTAEVDGMYYIALRSRGVCKIYPQLYEPNTYCDDLHINLEGGIYDLTLAFSFGPQDTDASAFRTWARMYIAGASFWDQDWVQVKDYFGQVMNAMPNLSDSSCVSARERWRLASISYAKYLMDKGDFCGAEDQLNEAFSIETSKNEPFYPTATEVYDECHGNDEAPPEDQPLATETPASETPTPEISPTETPAAPTP